MEEASHDPHPIRGWNSRPERPSLPEVHRSLQVPANAGFFRKMLAFAGPGYLVAVGYMDPGNWATDIAGGARFGFTLLTVIILSNCMAMVLQALSLKLGIASGRDLAQACRDHYSKPVVLVLWVLCELAIAACDLAEVLGSAIALKLLFGFPLLLGVCITVLDVLILFLQSRGFRYLEVVVIALMSTIGGCFGLELLFSKPDLGGILQGMIPTMRIVTDPGTLYIAIGILGATVMPHNLYLHSSIVQTRRYELTPVGKREAIKFATIDSSLALLFALLINAAILIMAAATFHRSGRHEVAGIAQAYELLSPLLGAGAASTLFAVALLASGQNSTLTGTLAGQIVMEGFLNLRLRPWLRRLITRLIAVAPAVVVIVVSGEQAVEKLLVMSQVILSMQLSFAVFPLVRFTGDKLKMGEFVNPLWLQTLGWLIALLIAFFNIWLLFQIFTGS